MTGDKWLMSKGRRRLELATIAGLAPVLGLVAVPAALAVNQAQDGGPFIHEVDRALTPSRPYRAKKFGDPANTSRVMTLCRKAMLDELPQLVDIINQKDNPNRMSLWGPRADHPDHRADQFAAVFEADYELGCLWEETLALYNPGILSTYANLSHSNNLEALTESERFSADGIILLNGIVRARADIYDRQVASPGHDIRLLSQTYDMAVGNYQQYAQRVLG